MNGSYRPELHNEEVWFSLWGNDKRPHGDDLSAATEADKTSSEQTAAPVRVIKVSSYQLKFCAVCGKRKTSVFPFEK